MRSFAALLVASSLLAAPWPAYADPPSAARFLDDARALAARGHCDEALRLRPVIERLDPELAGARFTADPAIAACLAGTAPTPVPKGEPPSDARNTAPAPPTTEARAPALPAPPSCGQLGAYIEPSLLAGVGTPGFGVLARYAVGVRLIDCRKDAGEGFVIRLGGTFTLRTARLGFGPPSGAGGGAAYPAGGGELEASYPIHGLRIGARVGFEDYDGSMTTVGLRVRYRGAAFGLDGFLSQSTNYTSLPTTSDGGVVLSIGLGADVGVAGFLGGLGLAGLVALAGLATAGGN